MPLSAGPVSQQAPRQQRASLTGRPRPFVFELVGPAGAGKTAVLRALGARDSQVRAGLRIDRLRFSPILLIHALALLPMSVELLWRQPRAWWPSLVHVLRLRTLPAVLARETRADHRSVLLDEGPVFSLARLGVFQRAHHGGGRLEREWHRAFASCLQCLDGVVWLDAANSVLTRRIRDRSKSHRVKGGTDAKVAGFLGRYREVYREILEATRGSGRLRVIEIDTGSQTIDQAVSTILKAFPPSGSRAEPAGGG